MSETINEPVSVAFWSSYEPRKIFPYSIHWHGRRYLITHVGLHHTYREGRVLIHVFSVTDGSTFFKLLLNTETLEWRLMEIESQNEANFTSLS
jgi:hypothetical protein